MTRVQPAAVLGMGGFVSGSRGCGRLAHAPAVGHSRAEFRRRTTNRLLSRLAARVFEAFPGSFPSSAAAIQVGNPVRDSLTRIEDPRSRLGARGGDRRKLLVLGGSQGARSLNQALPAALALIPAADRPEIWHQAGAAATEVAADYEHAGVDARVTPFIDDMASAYAWADIAVCRAGALTLAELAAVGLGAILIPYPHAIDDHQRKNAQYFVDRGAAEMLTESQLSPESLSTLLMTLLSQSDRILELARVSRALDNPSAAMRVANACVELVR